jgi:hypothetical protein
VTAAGDEVYLALELRADEEDEVQAAAAWGEGDVDERIIPSPSIYRGIL